MKVRVGDMGSIRKALESLVGMPISQAASEVSNDKPVLYRLDNLLIFYCPACKSHHPYNVDTNRHPYWQWNGDMIKPTFTPSLGVLAHDGKSRFSCHLYVTEGMINYCSDCPHEYASKTIAMLPVD